MLTPPSKTHFLYRFTAGSVEYLFTNIAQETTVDGETFAPIEIHHTRPTFSGEVQEGEIDITIVETCPLTELFINGPPPYPVIVMIYEYDRITEVATPYYRGWVIRPDLSLDDSTVSYHCKTVWHYFERQSFVDSLAALSRYSIFDPRSGVDIEPLRVGITVTALNDERDVLTVTGITEIDGYFTGGMIVAPDQDRRTILKHVTESGAKKLYLNGAFPMFTLAAGFSANVYPGDDLTYDTWANKFDSVTNNGEAFGGWPFMPNTDPAIRGVI